MKAHREMERLLFNLEERAKSINIELSYCPEGQLTMYARNGHWQYYQVIRTDGVVERRGVTRRPDIASKLARKEYLTTELRLVEKDISTLHRMLHILATGYVEPSPDNVLKLMPKHLIRFPEEWLFQRASSCGPTFGGANTANSEASPPSQAVDAITWEHMSYEKSTFNTENLLHTTSRGLRLRSKSEVMIAEKLYQHGIPFRYEEMLHVGDKVVVPDFTIRLPNGELKYWEHCGLPGNPDYMARHKAKMQLYTTVGIVPWKNLIVTYDDEHGSINVAMIDNTIRGHLLDDYEQ